MQVQNSYLTRIKDPHFKVRFVNEFQRVTAWVEKVVDIRAANIFDFGCGTGIAALSFALNLPGAKVHGSDITTNIARSLLKKAKRELDLGKLPENLTLHEMGPCELPKPARKFDLIYSWSVFEHVRREHIAELLLRLKSTLRPGGVFFLQVNPLYYSSRGAHLYQHISCPWVHLLHQHDVLREMVYSSTNKNQRAWLQYEALNRITADELLELFGQAGFSLLRETRKESKIDPPAQLLRVYRKDVLITEESMAMFTI